MADKRIVWQPVSIYQPGFDFGILLDRDFASLMLRAKLSPQSRDQVNNLGRDFLQRIGYSNYTPFDFFEESCFVTQFSLGRNGIWLAVDGTSGKNPLGVYREKPIKYSSHNCDASKDSIGLMGLVDIWVEYSEMLREGRIKKEVYLKKKEIP